MGSDIKYSICATHYNNSDWIEDSVGTILDQIESRNEWELVISDAGSTDGSLEYLERFSDRTDFTLLVEDGLSIGEGRHLAACNASGNYMLHIPDLDAVLHDDGRIVSIGHLFEELTSEFGDIMAYIGLFAFTKNCYFNLGGFRDFQAGEETEISRRALRASKYRLVEYEIEEYQEEREKFRSKARRFLDNSQTKFQCGVEYWHFMMYLLQNGTNSHKIAACTLLPMAYIKSKRADGRYHDSYRRYDQYLINFRQKVYNYRPELEIQLGKYDTYLPSNKK